MHKKTVKGFILGLSTAVILGSATLSVGAATGTFKDVKAGAWYESAVLWAQEKGIVSGYPDGTFKPNSNVTRAEVTGVVQNLAKEGYIDADIPLKAVDGYGKPTVTYEKFKAIQLGRMTLKDVEGLFGQQLKYDRTNYAYYIDDGKGRITINVNPYDNNVVTGKYAPIGESALAGIIKRYPQVTEQNFYKLENGMSNEQASAILGGKGLLIVDVIGSQRYRWQSREGRAIELSFVKDGDGLSLLLDSGSRFIE